MIGDKQQEQGFVTVATKVSESMAHVLNQIARAKGIKVYKTMVGNYMTSLEMNGFSISLLRLDDELKALLDAPADTPALKV